MLGSTLCRTQNKLGSGDVQDRNSLGSCMCKTQNSLESWPRTRPKIALERNCSGLKQPWVLPVQNPKQPWDRPSAGPKIALGPSQCRTQNSLDSWSGSTQNSAGSKQCWVPAKCRIQNSLGSYQHQDSKCFMKIKGEPAAQRGPPTLYILKENPFSLQKLHN